ncbi:MAG: CHAT domain-containing protein [Pyrinomonadaceae bacterium]|nr:CHAT domain-containing protein [Pyrinomonadaceae bacterium]
MTDARRSSGVAKCGGCGSDLGEHEAWRLVFSDDAPELVEQVLSGKINWALCPHCGYEGGWLYPSIFTYIVVSEERAVCVTPSKVAGQQMGILREALDVEAIRQHGLDPKRLLLRTRITHDYRDIAEALEVPVQTVEQENAAILQYLERRSLSGRARIEHLIQGTLITGAVTLEAEEYTAEFFAEIKQYRETLKGDEDYRIPQMLDQIIDALDKRLNQTRKRLPRRDEMGALAEVFYSSKPAATRDFIKATFDHHLQEARKDVLQLRLFRLCKLQSQAQLLPHNAAFIESQPELMNLIEELIAGRDVEATILSESDRRMLPEIKRFIGSLTKEMLPEGLRGSSGSSEQTPPAPVWLAAGERVLAEVYGAIRSGSVPESLFEPISNMPLAEAYVYGEMGDALMQQDQPSGAMLYLTKAIDIVKGIFQSSGNSFDHWTGQLYGVCRGRLAELQKQYGRLEDAAGELQIARSVFEKIGAHDEILHSWREEAPIWIDLGQPQRAEEMFKHLVNATEGESSTEEAHDLMNFSNVYRRLQPWVEAELQFVDKSRDEPPPDDSDRIADPSSVEIEIPFENKGGIAVRITVAGNDEASFQDLVGNESLRLLYRALAVATLNNDIDLERRVMGRILAIYGERQCTSIANAILDRMLENSPMEDIGLDAQLFAFNRLRGLEDSWDDAGDQERANSARAERLQLLDFLLERENDGLSVLAVAELRGERACLLEGLGRLEEAHLQYRDAVEQLERSRLWLRHPDNKRGLQSGRWRLFVRAARNALRIYAGEQTRGEYLTEAWYYIQEGRSRAMLDVLAKATVQEVNEDGVASVRPAQFTEVSSRLPEDLAVLEYVLMPGSSGCPGSWTLFIAEPNKEQPWLAWQELDMDTVLEAQTKLADVAHEFEKEVVQYGFQSVPQDIDDCYKAALEALGDVLFPSGLLETLRANGYRRLVIVADAYLQGVPFAALRPMEAGKRGYLGLATEQSGFQLVLAPSSSIFGQWTEKAPVSDVTTRRQAALFIDPLGDLSQANPKVAQTFSEIESDLRDSQIEVKRLDGTEATPAAWLQETPECNLVMYFGHSFAGPQEEQSALMLSDGTDAIELVTAETIYRRASRGLFSNSSLFILASCSSGFATAGHWDSDRELRGLSVAHLYAGCGAVIAASRPLLDSPTLMLLKALVTEILAGSDAATCLTQAQQKMAALDSPYSHPHFWGYVGFMGTPGWSLVNH